MNIVKLKYLTIGISVFFLTALFTLILIYAASIKSHHKILLTDGENSRAVENDDTTCISQQNTHPPINLTSDNQRRIINAESSILKPQGNPTNAEKDTSVFSAAENPQGKDAGVARSVDPNDNKAVENDDTTDTNNKVPQINRPQGNPTNAEKDTSVFSAAENTQGKDAGVARSVDPNDNKVVENYDTTDTNNKVPQRNLTSTENPTGTAHSIEQQVDHNFTPTQTKGTITGLQENSTTASQHGDVVDAGLKNAVSDWGQLTCDINFFDTNSIVVKLFRLYVSSHPDMYIPYRNVKKSESIWDEMNNFFACYVQSRFNRADKTLPDQHKGVVKDRFYERLNSQVWLSQYSSSTMKCIMFFACNIEFELFYKRINDIKTYSQFADSFDEYMQSIPMIQLDSELNCWKSLAMTLMSDLAMHLFERTKESKKAGFENALQIISDVQSKNTIHDVIKFSIEQMCSNFKRKSNEILDRHKKDAKTSQEKSAPIGTSNEVLERYETDYIVKTESAQEVGPLDPTLQKIADNNKECIQINQHIDDFQTKTIKLLGEDIEQTKLIRGMIAACCNLLHEAIPVLYKNTESKGAESVLVNYALAILKEFLKKSTKPLENTKKDNITAAKEIIKHFRGTVRGVKFSAFNIAFSAFCDIDIKGAVKLVAKVLDLCVSHIEYMQNSTKDNYIKYSKCIAAVSNAFSKTKKIYFILECIPVQMIGQNYDGEILSEICNIKLFSANEKRSDDWSGEYYCYSDGITTSPKDLYDRLNACPETTVLKALKGKLEEINSLEHNVEKNVLRTAITVFMRLADSLDTLHKQNNNSEGKIDDIRVMCSKAQDHLEGINAFIEKHSRILSENKLKLYSPNHCIIGIQHVNSDKQKKISPEVLVKIFCMIHMAIHVQNLEEYRTKHKIESKEGSPPSNIKEAKAVSFGRLFGRK